MIYVDLLCPVHPGRHYTRDQYCRLFADTSHELDTFARRHLHIDAKRCERAEGRAFYWLDKGQRANALMWGVREGSFTPGRPQLNFPDTLFGIANPLIPGLT